MAFTSAKVLNTCCMIVVLLVFLIQLSAVVAFSQTLRRYTSLNHLAQAARAVLQNSTQISQMLADLNRVDFANVQVIQCLHSPVARYALLCSQEQASWVCQCEESLVSRLEQSFKQTLQQQVWLLGDVMIIPLSSCSMKMVKYSNEIYCGCVILNITEFTGAMGYMVGRCC